jgi:soluble lytic murein transglycosylase-like protein
LAGKTFSLGPGDYVFIGSDPGCAIPIPDDPTVSPRHACIFYDPSGRIRLKDLGSEHGTTRNGGRVKDSAVIKAGDRVTFGRLSTLHSSWWNALQASRMTRFSQLVKRSTPAASEDGTVAPLKAATIAAVIVALVGGFGAWRLTRRLGPAAEGRAPTQLAALAGQPSEGPRARVSSAKRAVLTGAAQITAERRYIWDEILAISQRFGDPPPSVMDVEFVKEVEKNIHGNMVGNRHLTLLERKERLWPIIAEVLRERRLPVELGYVVWVESEFDPRALSPAGAAGLWQLLPETAREYGLVVQPGRDDRLDPRKSTMAAAAYFTDLIRMFKSQRYLLAIASYNTGQVRVQRLQLAAYDAERADFWQLRQQLSQETNRYVLRIMAAMIIGRNPAHWGAVGH